MLWGPAHAATRAQMRVTSSAATDEAHAAGADPPGPKTGKTHPERKIDPYFLKDLPTARPGRGWCAEIGSIPMRRGFLSRVAIMD